MLKANKKNKNLESPHKKRERKLALLFITPSLVIFSLFMFWPVLYTFYLSFFKWNMVSKNKKFIMFDNYISLFTDPVMKQIIANTIVYILILIFINFLIPYIISYILTFMVKKRQGLYKALIFMPSIISLVVGSIIFLWIFNPISGPIGQLCKAIGLTMPVWSKTNVLVIIVLSLITSYKTFGYNLIVMLSGVGSVSNELIEAARLEKTSNFRIFKDIVVPLTASTGIYVLIITVVFGLQYVFTPIKVLTDGGPNNMSSNLIFGVYQEAFTYFQTGRASALSILSMIIFIIMLYLEFKYVEKGIYYEN